MTKYDSEEQGALTLHDFRKLQQEVTIQKAFDHITGELRRCEGWHRHIHLWEFVEGKDWTLCTRFAELTGLMLQNTRMRSGSSKGLRTSKIWGGEGRGHQTHNV